MTHPAPNGHGQQPTDEDRAADFVHANYGLFAQQIGALAILVNNLPLDAMLAACKRYQTSSLLLTAGSADQARALHQGHRNDQKLIEAAIAVQRVYRAIAAGQAL